MIKKEYCLNGHKRTPDNLYSSGNCRACNLEQVRYRYYNETGYKEKSILQAKIYQKSDKWRDSQLKREYGLSLIEYKYMLGQQENSCAICHVHINNLTRPLNVDHNHQTGKVRGLLCCNCNTAIGLFKDNPASMGRAMEYLGGSFNGETISSQKHVSSTKS